MTEINDKIDKIIQGLPAQIKAKIKPELQREANKVVEVLNKALQMRAKPTEISHTLNRDTLSSLLDNEQKALEFVKQAAKQAKREVAKHEKAFAADKKNLEGIKADVDLYIFAFLHDREPNRDEEAKLADAKERIKQIKNPDLLEQASGYLDEAARAKTSFNAKMMVKREGEERDLKALEGLAKKGQALLKEGASPQQMKMLVSGADSYYKGIVSPDLKALADVVMQKIQRLI